MSVLSKPYMHDEAAAFAHVESIIWPDGPVERNESFVNGPQGSDVAECESRVVVKPLGR